MFMPGRRHRVPAHAHVHRDHHRDLGRDHRLGRHGDSEVDSVAAP